MRKRPPVMRLPLSKSQELVLISAARKIQSIAGQNNSSSKPFQFQFPAQAHNKVVGQVGGPNISFLRGNIQTKVFQEYKHQDPLLLRSGSRLTLLSISDSATPATDYEGAVTQFMATVSEFPSSIQQQQSPEEAVLWRRCSSKPRSQGLTSSAFRSSSREDERERQITKLGFG
ncbi:hypothetical protein DM860_015496 [Cuscuta australis]|uniref:Uncharacterized protein n=1 Tax=Cuscuta australis TaxID=267555 RepID=A0A328DIP6_9ASTE|nr:hypothetical protein DM860_015496 [Cuscuta australis]